MCLPCLTNKGVAKFTQTKTESRCLKSAASALSLTYLPSWPSENHDKTRPVSRLVTATVHLSRCLLNLPDDGCVELLSPRVHGPTAERLHDCSQLR